MSESSLPPLDAALQPLKLGSDFADEGLRLARKFAALSGPFPPQEALRAADAVEDLDLAVFVSAALAAACDTQAAEGNETLAAAGKLWLMRATERWWELENLRTSAGLTAAVAWRRSLAPDPATKDLLAALLGEGAFALDAVDRQIADAEADAPDREMLQRLAAALEWGGPTASSYPRLDRVRAALNRLDEQNRGDLLLQHGFHGRDEQRAALAAWIGNPAPIEHQVTALYVRGLPAVGKSTLLEQAVREAAGGGLRALVVRLDFDRPGLDVTDRIGLTVEVARQIAAQLPDAAVELRKERLAAVTTEEAQTKGGSGRERLPYGLTNAMAAAVRESGRTLLLVADTLEVLRGRGETHPEELFRWLDALSMSGVAPLVVIAAGRGDALGSAQNRIAEELTLDSLGQADAERLLDSVGAPQALHDTIFARSGGNPLQLRRLGALAALEGEVGLAAADDSSSLYRALESRIGGRYGPLVRFAPLVRRIDRSVLRDVLAPAVGLPRLTVDAADQLWRELKEQVWLVRGEDPAGWLRLHSELRRDLVEKLHAEADGRAQRVHRRAATWFADVREPWAREEALYHRLQATRWQDDADLKDMNLEAGVGFDRATLDELPRAAADAVLRARGERSSAGRESFAADSQPLSTGEVDDLRMMLQRGDLAEAAHFYARTFEVASVDPVSAAADVALTFLWRVGRWREARQLAQERAWTRPWDEGLADAWPDAALVRVEMQAEFDIAGLRRWLEGADHRAMVERLARTSKVDLYFGALGFALAGAGARPGETWRTGDPVSAVIDLWTPGGEGPALQQALSLAQSRRQRALRAEPAFSVEPERSRQARALAVLSPYADIAGWRLRTEPDGRLQTLTAFQLQHLSPDESGEVVPTTEPAAVLADLGLTAEWTAAAGRVLRNRDLNLIARSAERWRRTAAGVWSYRQRPAGWAGKRRGSLDVVTDARIARLLADPSPAEAARASLVGWMGPSETPAALVEQRGLRRIVASVAGDPDNDRQERAARVASALMGRWTPAGLTPGLAVLAVVEAGDNDD